MKPQASPALLDVENISLAFGGLVAVSNLSLTLAAGELAGLIGPNGAGKTTVFNILSGIYQPNSGEVRVMGRSMKGLKPHQITHLGLVRTFQNIRLFKSLSVQDNIKVAFHHQRPYGVLESVWQDKNYRRTEEQFSQQAAKLMQLLELASPGRMAAELPYGDQKKLEIARAVATGARILLLDEPAAGMNPHESAWLMQAIRRIQSEFQLSVLLIEHDMKVVMGICQRIIVMDHGAKIAEGTPKEIQKDAKVIEAYLGLKEKKH